MTQRMNPEIKAAWVAWLRDPSHKQGYNYLNKNGKYCCLGGLCELAVQARVISGFTDTTRVDNEGMTYYYGASGVLPEVVVRWAGLGDSRSYITELSVLNGPNQDRDTRMYDLTRLNDSHEFTFEQIADIIDYFL